MPYRSVDRARDRLSWGPLTWRVVLAMIKGRAAAPQAWTCCDTVRAPGIMV
ncbi:MAG: hypothetical protein OXU81_06915 [Gammaproteobacteria bacterium]|nr:hypothetical protein [Gammaproteobacteria bacterium]